MPLKIEVDSCRDAPNDPFVPLKDCTEGVYRTFAGSVVVLIRDTVVFAADGGTPCSFSKSVYESTRVRPYNGSVTLTFSNGENHDHEFLQR